MIEGSDTIQSFLICVLFGFGLVLIVWGGDRFVDAAAWLAEVSGIPRFVVGATVVSVATTLPEIIVSVMAAVSGEPEMAAGNAIGSVTANTALIFAIPVLFLPFTVSRHSYLPKALLFAGAILLLLVLSLGGRLTIFGCVAMLLLFSYHIYRNIREAKSAEPEPIDERGSVIPHILRFILGAAAIVLGSRLLVDNGEMIARDLLHVDERVVSLTFLAVGTSLPELVTAVSAVVKREPALTAGNILGANIIDMLLILPLCCIVSGGSLPIAPEIVWLDLPFCLLCAVILPVIAALRGSFSRWQGVLSVMLYGVYLFFLLR